MKRYRWFNTVTKEMVSNPNHPEGILAEDEEGIFDSYWIPIVNYNRLRYWRSKYDFYLGESNWDKHANQELRDAYYMVEVWNGKKFKTEKRFAYEQFIDSNIENPKRLEAKF